MTEVKVDLLAVLGGDGDEEVGGSHAGLRKFCRLRDRRGLNWRFLNVR